MFRYITKPIAFTDTADTICWNTGRRATAIARSACKTVKRDDNGSSNVLNIPSRTGENILSVSTATIQMTAFAIKDSDMALAARKLDTQENHQAFLDFQQRIIEEFALPPVHE
jgi:hypothetical protein